MLVTGLTAQTVQLTPTKCLKKGAFSLNGFYGGVYLFDEAMNKRQSITDLKYHNNIGINCKYMINKTIGFGLEYTYSRSSFTEYLYSHGFCQTLQYV